MYVDALEPVSTHSDLDEVTQVNLGPADVSAWTPTETLSREMFPAPPESWWLAWAAVTGGLAGAVVVLAVLVTALAITA